MLGMLAGGLGAGANVGLQGLQTVFGWLTTAFRFVGGQLMGLGGLLLRFGALLGGVIVGGLTAFVAAIGAATKAGMEYARGIVNLRNSTGMGMGAAQRAGGLFGAFGVGADALGNGGQYHGITRMVGGAYGVNPFDPASINSRAQSFGSGFMGHAMRQSMLSGIGQNTPQGQWLANLPQNKVAGQVAFQQNASNSIGIGPDAMRRLAEDLPLVLQRFNILRELLVNRIAAAALPHLEAALTRAADFLSANADTIANGVSKAIDILANAFTWIGNFLIQRGPMIAQAIYSVVEWLYARAPHLLIGGLQTLIKAGQGFVEFFANLGHSLADQLRLFDQSEGYLYAAVKGIAGAFDSVLNTFRWFGAGLATASAFLQTVAAGSPLLQGISMITGNGRIKPVNPVTAARDYFNANPESNLVGQIPKLQNGTATDWAKQLDAGANRMTGASSRYGGAAISFLQDLANKLGPEDQRRADFKAMIEELKKGNMISEKVVSNTEKTAQGINGFANRTAERVLSHVVADTYLGAVGS